MVLAARGVRPVWLVIRARSFCRFKRAPKLWSAQDVDSAEDAVTP